MDIFLFISNGDIWSKRAISIIVIIMQGIVHVIINCMSLTERTKHVLAASVLSSQTKVVFLID